MTWAMAIALTAGLAATGQSQSYEYLGWFAGTAQVRVFPMTGYYYSPSTPLPPEVLARTVVVRIKVLDGGSICPSLTRYKTYLYSPRPLAGQYMLPRAGLRLYPTLPVGWPFKPLSSLGWQVSSR